MKKNKVIITATIISILMLTGFYQMVSAQTNSNYPSIIQKLASKFNLKVGDVEAVFAEAKAEREAQQQAEFEKILEQAVANGELTSAQKEVILQKRADLAATLKNMANLTPTERKQTLDKIRTDMKSWAETNGINLKYLFGFGIKGFGRGHKGFEGFNGPEELQPQAN